MQSTPRHTGLLLAVASGFVQYADGSVQLNGDRIATASLRPPRCWRTQDILAHRDPESCPSTSPRVEKALLKRERLSVDPTLFHCWPVILVRVLTYRSWLPSPPGRFEPKYNSVPSHESAGR